MILRFLPRIIGVLLVLLLAGCSAIRTGYNNAPTLLYWWLDGYMEFTDAQEPLVRNSLAELHRWHRREELPAYADLLGRMQQAASAATTPEQVCTYARQIRVHVQRLVDQGAEGMALITPTLQDEQLRHLDLEFEKSNQKWREQWLDGSSAELLDRRVERTVERFENFYGRLSDKQKELLRQRLGASGFDARVAWAERLRRQEDMLRVLQEHRSADRAAHRKAEMLALLRRSVEPQDGEARAQYERMWQEGCQTLAALHNSASPVQRQRLIEKLQGYENDFRTLAANR